MERVRLVPMATVPKNTVIQNGITTANSTMALPRFDLLQVESLIRSPLLAAWRANAVDAGARYVRGCGVDAQRVHAPPTRHHPGPRKARYPDFHKITVGVAGGRLPGVGRRVESIVIDSDLRIGRAAQKAE